MKVKNITDIDKFFETIEQCKGKIELITSEGDRINLKSKLCQYIMMSKLFSDAKIDEVEIIASEPEDLHRILEYLVRA